MDFQFFHNPLAINERFLEFTLPAPPEPPGPRASAVQDASAIELQRGGSGCPDCSLQPCEGRFVNPCHDPLPPHHRAPTHPSCSPLRFGFRWTSHAASKSRHPP